MIDTHCHLNLAPLIENVDTYYQTAIDTGVHDMIVVGTDLQTSAKAIELANRYDHLYPSIGIHPEEANGKTSQEIETLIKDLEALAQTVHPIAIGECGLDYSELHLQEAATAKEWQTRQRTLFGAHIKIAKHNDLPLLIHARNVRSRTDTPQHNLNAYNDILDTIEHFSKDDGVVPPFVLHCMSGELDYLHRALAMGAFISFAGNVTYPNAQAIRTLLHATPVDRLLIETDSPFLAPQGKRGTTNEPSLVTEVCAFIAGELQMTTQEVDTLTTKNAKQFFRIS